MLQFFEELSEDAKAAKTLVTKHLDDPSLYRCSEKDTLLMIQSAEGFVGSL